MRNLYKILILTLLFTSYGTTLLAQYRKDPKILEGLTVSPRVGINMFFGDLVDESRTSYVLGGVVERELTPYLCGRIQSTYARLKGSQVNKGTPYVSFKSHFIQTEIGATFKPLSLFLGYFKQRSFKPYIIGQFGLSYYNATAFFEKGAAIVENDGVSYGLADKVVKAGDEMRNVSGVTPTISFGGGLQYWLFTGMSVTMDLVATRPLSDKLDAYWYWYHFPQGVKDVNQTDAQDFLYTLTVGITYTIKDSPWRNEPKYNRKAYLKTKRSLNYKPKKRSYYNKRNMRK